MSKETETLKSLLSAIQNGDLLNSSTFKNIDLDAILERRDSEPFANVWTAASEQVEAAWQGNQWPEDDLALLEAIRKEAFLAVTRAAGQHEISSYVSDDFDLICKAIMLDDDNFFVMGMLANYREGMIPH